MRITLACSLALCLAVGCSKEPPPQVAQPATPAPATPQRSMPDIDELIEPSTPDETPEVAPLMASQADLDAWAERLESDATAAEQALRIAEGEFELYRNVASFASHLMKDLRPRSWSEPDLPQGISELRNGLRNKEVAGTVVAMVDADQRRRHLKSEPQRLRDAAAVLREAGLGEEPSELSEEVAAAYGTRFTLRGPTPPNYSAESIDELIGQTPFAENLPTNRDEWKDVRDKVDSDATFGEWESLSTADRLAAIELQSLNIESLSPSRLPKRLEEFGTPDDLTDPQRWRLERLNTLVAAHTAPQDLLPEPEPKKPRGGAFFRPDYSLSGSLLAQADQSNDQSGDEAAFATPPISPQASFVSPKKINRLALSGDGKTIILIPDGAADELRSAESGELIAAFDCSGGQQPVGSQTMLQVDAVFWPGPDDAATNCFGAGLVGVSGDGMTRVVLDFGGPASLVQAHDGRLLATVGNQVRAYDADGDITAMTPGGGLFGRVRLSHDGRIAGSSGGGGLTIIDARTGTTLQTMPKFSQPDLAKIDPHFAHVYSSGNQLPLTGTGQISNPQVGHSIEVSPNGRFLARMTFDPESRGTRIGVGPVGEPATAFAEGTRIWIGDRYVEIDDGYRKLPPKLVDAATGVTRTLDLPEGTRLDDDFVRISDDGETFTVTTQTGEPTVYVFNAPMPETDGGLAGDVAY